jgi:hypothetical protein
MLGYRFAHDGARSRPVAPTHARRSIDLLGCRLLAELIVRSSYSNIGDVLGTCHRRRMNRESLPHCNGRCLWAPHHRPRLACDRRVDIVGARSVVPSHHGDLRGAVRVGGAPAGYSADSDRRLELLTVARIAVITPIRHTRSADMTALAPTLSPVRSRC